MARNANTNKEVNTAEVEDKRVDLFIPKGSVNDEPNQLISVNGVNYLLPKGKTSNVPPEVAYEYNRALRAQQKMDEHIEEMLEASK